MSDDETRPYVDARPEGLDESDDELSELDEEQFKGIDESNLGKVAPTVVLPSFKKNKQIGEREKKPKGQRRRREDITEEEIQEQAPLDPIAAKQKELDEQFNVALKAKKRRKRMNEDDLEKFADDEINALREKMREAAYADQTANDAKQAATTKLKMLPEVLDVLQRSTFYEAMLDLNFLEAMKMWLEPLPDKSLPAYDIQRELFSALSRLPIRTDHLRESKIGPLVQFYARSKKADESVRRMAEKLISDWSRPIMRRSNDFRSRAVAQVDWSAQERVVAESGGALGGGGASRGGASRAAVPRASTASYSVAPRAILPASTSNAQTVAVDQRRRLNAFMKTSRPPRKAGGVRIN